MKKAALALAALLLTLAAVMLVLAPSLHAQPAPAPSPRGVWRATLDGVPSVILTLADDTGSLGGTVVFSSVDGETKTAISIEPHTLLRPKLDGSTLTFQVRRRDARLITFKVVFTSPTEAQLRCLDCTPDNPTAYLTKDTL
jgi:hypothetical protein